MSPLSAANVRSLGELFRELTGKGVRAVDGFSTTSAAYNLLLETGGLRKRLQKLLKGLDVDNLEELARVGSEARALMLETAFPADVEAAIFDGYKRLGERIGKKSFEVAVRSSATAEDLPDASFAGQQDTILNVRGERQLIEACHQCFASLWTDRAISYRTAKNFDHFDVALSIGVQPMVRSDIACSGVMFTLDTESGFREAVVINGAWGLGEAVVQGMATPDEWIIFKPTLKLGFRPIVTRKLGVKEVKMVFADDGTGTQVRDVVASQRKRFCLSGYDVLQLADWACEIEDHYSKLAGKPQPMDIEWAKDGITGELFILQARPETVQSQKSGNFIETYKLDSNHGAPLVTGVAVGERIGHGNVHVLARPEQDPQLQRRRYSGYFDDRSGLGADNETRFGNRYRPRRHELATAQSSAENSDLPCIVGTGNATEILRSGTDVTVSCAEGERGNIYYGTIPFDVERHEITDAERPKTQVMMNVGDPDHAFSVAQLPNDGVGLARLEFIINNHIGIHPMALVNYPNLKSRADIDTIAERILEEDPKEFFVRTSRRRHRQNRGGVLSERCYRADVRLQIQRIRTADWRTRI